MHLRHFAFSPVLALLVACGSSASPSAPSPTPAESTDPTQTTDDPPSPPAVDNGAPSTSYPAPHSPMPEVVNQAGGAVLATPRVELLVFPGYEHTAALEDFVKGLGATPYWKAVTEEYGVGAITFVATKELTGETAPTSISDKEVEQYVKSKIASGDLGAPDANTIYSIVYPASTTITESSGPLGAGKSCSSFGGYHSDTAISVGGKTQNYPFAVIPTCPGFGSMQGIDELTGAFSHELVEAATDPYPSTNGGTDSAYSSVDMDHFIWILAGGMETGDLCAQNADSFTKLAGFPYTVQRSWSNKSAKAGHDPCVPVASASYFQSAPKLDDDVTLTLPPQLGGQDVPTKGVVIPVGQSKTIEVDLYSDGPTSGPWTVSADDAFARIGGSKTLDFAWDRTQGVNGEKLHLTITVKGESSFVPGSHAFVITSKLGDKKVTWPGLVVEK